MFVIYWQKRAQIRTIDAKVQPTQEEEDIEVIIISVSLQNLPSVPLTWYNLV